ncbi:tetratricopeptide repeat protein, partial [Singulisphaera rosea]
MRTAAKFVEGLRERGYYDLAEEFLERLRANPETPEDLRLKIDFEQAKLMSAEAATSADIVLQKEMLDKARSKLIAFTKDHPTHPQAAEAFVKLGSLLVERGYLAMIRAEDPDEKDKPRFLSEARTSYREARDAYVQADEKLTAAFNSFPPHIPENKPDLIEERNRVTSERMMAQLQKAMVDYQEGQTFPAGSKERNESLTKGLTQFDDIYKRYRTMHAGLTARMWQAKCYEEKGEYGAAMGLYNELMRHDAPELRGLQRHVGYFQILLYNKRKEYPLAELGAQGWLKTYGSAAELKSSLSLSIGVRLEMAKAILAQIPEASTAGEKADRKGRAVELLSQIVRYTSPQKAEALKLLKENKPSAAARFEDVARLNFDEAMGQAEEAMASQEWPKAILLLKQAIRRADPVKDADKVLLPRHRLALSYYNNHQPYEALVISEHIARRYPFKPLGPKAAELGIGSLAEAYNTFVEIDRGSDLNRLIDLAKYTVATWPDKEEGDYARTTLGQLAHGLGKYTEAIE